MLSPGERVGDYEIEAELGEGGMARVYRARHTVLDTLHAVKVLEPRYRADPETRKRFLAEAKIQAKHLDHPNIVRVTNIVATPEHAALVMELVDGPDLEELSGKIKDPNQIKEIFAGILAGVGSAHAQKIIHRDLKPANVLLDKKPDGGFFPKLTDFGIAKVTRPEGGKKKKSTHADARMGTLHYMSPEQIRRAKDVTERSDIFSLGAMLYELVTGEVPFEGDSDFDIMEKIVRGNFVPAGTRVKKLDPVIDEVIRKALSPDPADRYASCQEMAAAMSGSATGGVAATAAAAARAATPVSVRAASIAGGEGGGRRTGAVVAILLGVVVAGGAGLFYASRGGDPSHSAQPGPDPETTPPLATYDPETTPPLATYDPETGITTPTDDSIKIGISATDASIADRLLVPTPIDASLSDRLKLPPASPELAELANQAPDTGSNRIEALEKPNYQKKIADAIKVTKPAPPPCSGSFRSAEGLNIRVTGTRGNCGTYGFAEETRSGIRTCTGDLTGCSLSQGTITAHFGCSYSSGTSQRFAGSMQLRCSGRNLSADVKTGTSKRTWKLHK